MKTRGAVPFARWCRVFAAAVAAAAVLIGGCGGFGGGADDGGGGRGGATCGEPVEVGGLPCDVAAVLEERCQTCHREPPEGGAKFPLLRYEDLAAPLGMTGKRRWQRMAEVIEPEGLPHMPYKDSPQLSPAQLETLRAWLAACAPPEPQGGGCDAGE